MQHALGAWLQAAGLHPEHITLHGAGPGRRFHVEVHGGVVGNARALALAQALKLPNGRWRQFSAITVAGPAGPLYINPDRSPRTQRIEFQTKRLAQTLERNYTRIDFRPNRGKGEVKVDRMPIARVIVPNVPDEPSKIEWKRPEAQRLGIDCGLIDAEFHKLFRDQGSDVPWS